MKMQDYTFWMVLMQCNVIYSLQKKFYKINEK